eukprot:11173071-Heterocapsa_arctica.AAC.1
MSYVVRSYFGLVSRLPGSRAPWARPRPPRSSVLPRLGCCAMSGPDARLRRHAKGAMPAGPLAQQRTDLRVGCNPNLD